MICSNDGDSTSNSWLYIYLLPKNPNRKAKWISKSETETNRNPLKTETENSARVGSVGLFNFLSLQPTAHLRLLLLQILISLQHLLLPPRLQFCSFLFFFIRSTSSLYFLLSLASRSWTSLSILISPSRAGSWPSTAWLCHNAWCGTCSSQFPSLNGFSWTVFLVLSLLLFRFFRSVSVGVNATEAQLGSNFSSSSEPSRKPNLSVRFSSLDWFFQKIAHSYLRG